MCENFLVHSLKKRSWRARLFNNFISFLGNRRVFPFFLLVTQLFNFTHSTCCVFVFRLFETFSRSLCSPERDPSSARKKKFGFVSSYMKSLGSLEWNLNKEKKNKRRQSWTLWNVRGEIFSSFPKKIPKQLELFAHLAWDLSASQKKNFLRFSLTRLFAQNTSQYVPRKWSCSSRRRFKFKYSRFTSQFLTRQCNFLFISVNTPARAVFSHTFKLSLHFNPLHSYSLMLSVCQWASAQE